MGHLLYPGTPTQLRPQHPPSFITSSQKTDSARSQIRGDFPTSYKEGSTPRRFSFFPSRAPRIRMRGGEKNGHFYLQDCQLKSVAKSREKRQIEKLLFVQ